MSLPPVPQLLTNRELEDFLSKVKDQVDVLVVGSGSDHGGLTGLLDDDHPHYYTLTRLESWFASKGIVSGTDTDSDIISRAKVGQMNAITWSGNLPTTVVWANYDGFTGRTMNITYSGGLPIQTVFTFNYDGQSWTVTTDINYTSGKPTSTPFSVVKV